MGKLLCSFVFPHPPILIPEIGNGKESEAENTITAMERCAGIIEELNPDTIIITTPHGPIFSDYVFISEGSFVEGNFGNFNHKEIKLTFDNDLVLIKAIKIAALNKNFFCGDLSESQYKTFNIKKGLDHGALVPLYFAKKKLPSFKLVHISAAAFSNIDLYRFGMCIQEAIKNTEGTFVFIASGDLSHKYSLESPYGYHPKGPEFDHQLMAYFQTADVLGILNMKDTLCREAAECGMKSFIMMLGANNGVSLKTKVHSHEGPFGIGYGVVSLKPDGINKDKDFFTQMNDEYRKTVELAQSSENIYVQLALLSLKSYLLNKEIISIHDANIKLNLTETLLSTQAGAFVSIKKHGSLRGCIGTISPTQKTLAEEIIINAISAGIRDSRFEPITLSEFEDLIISVDVLSDSEPIPDASFLDVKKYGVIVESGYKRGLLLPNLEGVDTIEQQINIALSKAGITKNETYSLARFEVVRHQ